MLTPIQACPPDGVKSSGDSVKRYDWIIPNRYNRKAIMSQLILNNSQVTEQTATRSAHAEIPGTTQVISCTSLSDATSKLQTALTALIGSGPATTAANAFSARQTAAAAPSKHTVSVGANQGVTALFVP